MTSNNWEKEAQEFMDRLSIFDLEILNSIVYYKIKERDAEILGWIEGMKKPYPEGNFTDPTSWAEVGGEEISGWNDALTDLKSKITAVKESL